MKSKSPEKQLASLLSKYAPGVAATALAARKKLRERLRGAVEIVSGNSSAVTIGFSPTEQSSDVILSIGVYQGWVNVFFTNGEKLSDPQELLRGRGNQVRNILLVDASVLDRPAVQALVTEAAQRASKPIDAKAKRRLVIT